MNSAQFLRHCAEQTIDLNDEERAALADEVTKQVAAHMRVRRLKAEQAREFRAAAQTIPPEGET